MKKIEKARLFAVKKRYFNRWKTKDVVIAVEQQFNITISKRTVRRWVEQFKQGWNLKDKSRKPHTTHKKISIETEQQIVALVNKTGYEAYKIHEITKDKTNISLSSVKRIISKHGLSNGSVMQGKKIKYYRWQRDTPNSLWQLDHTEEEDGTIRLPIMDDHSRYCFAIYHWQNITTKKITNSLDELIEKYGKPREILTDNGSIYQKQFDKWCNKKGILHIRSHINKPTTCGKVEKLHDIYNREIGFWKTPEQWRYQYNCMRPHRSLDGATPNQEYNQFHKQLYYKPEKTYKN